MKEEKRRKIPALLLSVLLVLLMVPMLPGGVQKTYAADEVEINETNFPDTNFKNWVGTKADRDSSGSLSSEEIKRVGVIRVNDSNISSLKGIEYFTALQKLSCENNRIASLDLSRNTALTDLYCNDNRLTSLDLSRNTRLTLLCCHDNQLASLDLSRNTKLMLLNCQDNRLTSLDLSRNTALTSLMCDDNRLASLDLSRNTALIILSCYDNRLASLNVRSSTKLTTLECAKNQLASLDLSSNTALTTLNCAGNRFTSLDLSKNTALTTLECGGCRLTSLDLSQNTALTKLGCYNNQLASLDVGSNTALTTLHCEDNRFASLDVSRNAALTTLGCGNRRLMSLDVSRNTALTELKCTNSCLTALDLSRNTKLAKLSCAFNRLTSLDLSRNTALTALDCHYNQLASLDLSSNTALTELYCYDNQLTALDLSRNTGLAKLNCANNQLTSLDLSRNTALTKLECYNNQLASLDLSGGTALTTLDCYNNRLASLDVRGSTGLANLICSKNQLTSLDLSRNTALEALSCESNQLTALDLSANTRLDSAKVQFDSQTRHCEIFGDRLDLSSSDFEWPGLDMKKVSNVQAGNGCTYDSAASTITMTGDSPEFTYTYDSGCHGRQMPVTVALKKHVHSLEHHDAATATCTEPGHIGYWECKKCKKKFSDAAGSTEAASDVIIPASGHRFGGWNVTKQPTTTAQGEKERTCSKCGYVEKAEMPRLSPDKITARYVKKLLATKAEADPAGSRISPMFLRPYKVGRASTSIKWNKVKGAAKYVIFANKCGRRYRAAATAAATTKKISKIAGKKLQKGRYYKYFVAAFDKNGKQIAVSKAIHVAAKGGKVCNYRSVRIKNVKKGRKTLQRGKTFKLKVKAVKESKKRRVQKHRGIRCESSNTAVAAVSSRGTIKAKARGSCTICVCTQDGRTAKVKVKVK
ncbi:MAG: Ig-like domain-containing protein [Anaerovoracaceae bacterium]|jgi:hypothetical protein